jgi:hypothetical protein
MNTMPEKTELARRSNTEQKTSKDEEVRPEGERRTWSLPAPLISKRDAEAEGPCTD